MTQDMYEKAPNTYLSALMQIVECHKTQNKCEKAF